MHDLCMGRSYIRSLELYSFFVYFSAMTTLTAAHFQAIRVQAIRVFARAKLAAPVLIFFFLVAGGVGILAVTAPLTLALPEATAVVLVAAVGFETDATVGLLAGLGAAAGGIWLARHQGRWEPADFGPTLLWVALVLTVGGTSAMNRCWLQRLLVRDDFGGTGGDALEPRDGLLGFEVATVRLEEEQARAARYRSPLAVFRLTVEIDDRVSPPERKAVEQAVRRTLLAKLRVIDVPFRCPGGAGVILPMTNAEGARCFARRLAFSIVQTTYAGAERRRCLVGEVATVAVRTAAYPDDGESAAALLEAAIPDPVPALLPIGPAASEAGASAADSTEPASEGPSGWVSPLGGPA